MKEKKKTFDAVAFMRKRREELSWAYAGLSAEQIEERVQQELKDDPLWRRHNQDAGPLVLKKGNRWLSLSTHSIPEIRHPRERRFHQDQG